MVFKSTFMVTTKIAIRNTINEKIAKKTQYKHQVTYVSISSMNANVLFPMWYMFKFNNKDTRTTHFSCIFYEHISYLVPVFLLLTLNM